MTSQRFLTVLKRKFKFKMEILAGKTWKCRSKAITLRKRGLKLKSQAKYSVHYIRWIGLVAVEMTVDAKVIMIVLNCRPAGRSFGNQSEYFFLPCNHPVEIEVRQILQNSVKNIFLFLLLEFKQDCNWIALAPHKAYTVLIPVPAHSSRKQQKKNDDCK